MNKILKIELTAAIVLTGFFSAIVFHYIVSFYYQVSYPFNTFLFVGISFSDFYNDYISAQHLMPYSSTSLSSYPIPAYMSTTLMSVYFPVTYILMYPFTLISPQVSALCYSLLLIYFVVMCVRYYLTYSLPVAYKFLNYFLNFKNIFILSVMSYPVLFSFERGNAESILFALLMFFLFFYMKKQYFRSAVFLAAAIGMKIYPAVFLVLLLADKQYKSVIFCLSLAILTTFLALLLYQGTLSHQLHVLSQNLAFFKSHWIDASLGIRFNSSYFSFFETFTRLKYHISPTTAHFHSAVVLKNYALFCIIFFLSIVFYILCLEQILWKKIALLTASMILLPYISLDYKLLHLYLPFFIFVNTTSPAESSVSKSDILYTLIFALLFIPKNYYLLSGLESISSRINTILLTVLVFVIIIEGCWQRIQNLRNPI